MKIIHSNRGNVTNVEALEMLRERAARRDGERDRKKPKFGGSGKRSREVDGATKAAVEYLEKTVAGSQTVDQVASCVGFMRGAGDGRARDLGLNPRDILQIVNLAPTVPVVVYAIVEDCEEKLTEADVDEVIALSGGMLGGKQGGAPPDAT